MSLSSSEEINLSRCFALSSVRPAPFLNPIAPSSVASKSSQFGAAHVHVASKSSSLTDFAISRYEGPQLKKGTPRQTDSPKSQAFS